MRESLKMLRTEEGQLNAVFACFGSAAQHAQLFESALGEFMLSYKLLLNSTPTVEALESMSNAERKKTMGRLLTDVRKYVTFLEPEIDHKLTEALDARNFLMHNFFLEREERFRSGLGRMAMINELLGIETQLEEARGWFAGLRIAMLRATKAKHDPTGVHSSNAVFSVEIDLPDHS
jgi:hypothetical protein